MSRQYLKPRGILKVLAILILWVSCSAASCTTTLRNEQLESVAKDWALVIRASQVIPVYPLSEDLQPGDVLLVSTPIENQVKLYKDKGFLPLDQHLVRLYSTQFKEFYNSRYGTQDGIIPPAQWQTQDAQGVHNWKKAPRAAFPTYQFSVSTGSGLSLAIPIQGVPVALGLMNSGKASGTVTIADAFTFGLDNFHLTSLVQNWADQNRKLLRNYPPRDGQSHFLRVVSRVYATGRVSVTVNNDEATSAEARGGADRPLELMGIKQGATDANYQGAIQAINNMLSEQLPGGKIKVATASSRAVTLSETFERPLVIGYVGFDMQILEGGRLGPPISTLAQLTGGHTIPAYGTDNVYRLASLSHMYKALREIQGPDAERVRGDLDKLVSLLPEKYPFSLYEQTSPSVLQRDSTVVVGAKVDRKAFTDVVDYLGLAMKTTKTLEGYLPRAPRDSEAARSAASNLEQELQAARSAYADISNRLSGESALMRAVDFVFLGI